MYLLDTNICIYLMKKKPDSVFNKMRTLNMADITISSITLAELEYGANKSQFPEKSKQTLFEFVAPFQILSFDEKASGTYGTIRAYLENKGTPIGSMDMLIAAHAIAEDKILVTNNEKEFSRVPRIRIENWV